MVTEQTQITAKCDYPDCPHFSTVWGTTREDANHALFVLGWRLVRTKLYCLRHVEMHRRRSGGGQWVTCPVCNAKPFLPCTNEAGRPVKHSHLKRIQEAD